MQSHTESSAGSRRWLEKWLRAAGRKVNVTFGLCGCFPWRWMVLEARARILIFMVFSKYFLESNMHRGCDALNDPWAHKEQSIAEVQSIPGSGEMQK